LGDTIEKGINAAEIETVVKTTRGEDLHYNEDGRKRTAGMVWYELLPYGGMVWYGMVVYGGP
jgi:hypothetical protein